MNPNSPHENGISSHRQGSILLLVLVAIIIMTLTTTSYLLLMRNENIAAQYSGNHLQTQMLAQSGVDYLRVLLAQTPDEIEQQGGLIDNPDLLQDVLVIEDDLESYQGRFTVVAPEVSEGYYQDLRYGLENESAKLNLNSLIVDEEGSSSEDETLSPRDRLLVIPGMDETVADAILDWLDQDDTPRTDGAESSYYLSLTPSYQPRNGPIAHLDEMLMIQGVTPELLYGVDANRNYLVDADEQPRGALEQLDNSDGQLNRGWSAYLTVHSSEKNTTPDGEASIDLNAESLQTLHSELQQTLGPAEANFLIAYRQYGPAGPAASSPVVSAASVLPDFEKEAEKPIESFLDLVDARVEVPAKDKAPAQIIESPWKNNATSYRQGFADLLDVATVTPGERIAGRININLASRPVLLTIPGMTESLADQILSQRDAEVDLISGDQRHPSWLLADGLVTLEDFKPMMFQMTTGGDVFSAQVVGYFDAGTARSRAEVLLDRSGSQTRLLEWQDLSPLGPGFSRTILSSLVELDE